MDNIKIGNYIKQLRNNVGLTQKQLADKLNVSFQAVSKWENGDTLPGTDILIELSDALNTTVDKLLNGGSIVMKKRKLMKLEDIINGFECIENIGKYFGEDSTFYTGMIEGINNKMNIDILTYLKDPKTREVMYAEVLIQGILNGKTVDMDEIRVNFKNKKMIDTIQSFLDKIEE